MKYNPILSIILGAVVIIVLSFIAAVGLVEPNVNNNTIMDILCYNSYFYSNFRWIYCHLFC